jgi:hypothetical protein
MDIFTFVLRNKSFDTEPISLAVMRQGDITTVNKIYPKNPKRIDYIGDLCLNGMKVGALE